MLCRVYKFPFFFKERFLKVQLLKKKIGSNFYDTFSSRTAVFSVNFKKIVTFLSDGFFTILNSFFYSMSFTFKFLSFFFFLLNIARGLVKKFRTRLQLVGLRFRIDKIFKKSIILKLNLCHKIKWKCLSSKLFKFRKIKNSFGFKSNDFYLHGCFLGTIRKFKYPNIYKGNGIRLFREKLKLKKRKQFGSF